MSYDYEKYDGKRIVVDGEIIGLLAMEFGHEVEEVWEEYHAELTMTEEQERQSEAYKESLRRALSAQYEKVATLESENAKLRELIAKYSSAAKYLCGFSHCNECNLDCASVFGDVPSGWDCARMLLDKKARELGVEVNDGKQRDV